MKDGRVMNLDEKESEWQQEIRKLTDIIKKCDENIQQEQVKKQKAAEETDKYMRWIRTANEMYGSNGEGTKITTDVVSSVKNEIAGLNLKQAIRKILLGTSKGLTTKEITSILLEHNFKSGAKNFESVVFTSLYNLTRETNTDVIAEKKGVKNYYRLTQKDDKGEKRGIQGFFK